jgi:hypothetical protein
MKARIVTGIIGMVALFTGCVKTIEQLYISDKSYEVKNLNTTTSINGLFFINDQLGFLVGDSGKVYKTKDGGATWDIKSLGDYHLNDIHFCNEKEGFIAGRTNSAEIEFLTNLGSNGVVLRTTDGGETWEKTILENTNLNEIFCISKEKAFIPRAGSILMTKDGKNWEEKEFEGDTIIINGKKIFFPKSYDFNEICQLNATTLIAVGTQKSIITTDFFSTWKTFNFKATTISILDNKHLISSYEQSLYTSISDTTWNWLMQIDNFNGEGYYEIEDIEGISENYFFVIASHHIHRTLDRGQAWETIIPRDGRYNKLQRVGNFIFGIGVGTTYRINIGEEQFLIKITL